MATTAKNMEHQIRIFLLIVLASACLGLTSRSSGVRSASRSLSRYSSTTVGKGPLSGGAIAGVVCGVFAVAIIIAILICWKVGVLPDFCRRCQRSSGNDASMKYTADADVTGDPTSQCNGQTAPLSGASNISSFNYDNNINDSKSQEEGSNARYRGAAPPPSYDHVVSDSAQSSYPYKAPGGDFPQTDNQNGSLSYTTSPRSDLPYAADPSSSYPPSVPPYSS